MSNAKISVMAPGGWGTALAMLCCANGHDTVLWGKFEQEIAQLQRSRENPLLPGVRIPDEIEITTDIDRVRGSDMIILASPSFAIRETAARLRDIVGRDTVIVSVAKGFERDTLKRFTTVIAEELPENSVVALSGPSHAEEVARALPTSVVAASVDMAAAGAVQRLLSNERFRIYTNSDVIGVETGAALKNIIAMAAGICDGMGFGDNTVAALITRGIHEIRSLGVAMGAGRDTFSGLSGIGDLIVTCTSQHSRNRRFGVLLGQGMAIDAALESVGMTVESYYATAAAYQLAGQYGVEMPIVSECYNVLYRGGEPKQAVKRLMGRSMKNEIDR